MFTAPRPSSLRPELPFRFVAGDPALDLVNTVDWTSAGPAEERLTDFERLSRWAEGAGLLLPRLGAQFRSAAAERPRPAENAVREAKQLRWNLRQIFIAVARGESPAALPATAELNEALARSLAQLQLVGPSAGSEEGPALRWNWRDAGSRFDSILWPVVRSAAELLVSDEASRIRECGSPDCGWMYVDRSRNGLRRWCMMESCGTREKTRRRARRRSAEQ
jgi:predicted RNA-binding Zn ribbon-like protein